TNDLDLAVNVTLEPSSNVTSNLNFPLSIARVKESRAASTVGSLVLKVGVGPGITV
ncbi:unnamed protein product, partial [Rotaria socialis]